MKTQPDSKEIAKLLLEGNRRALAKAITLVESKMAQDRVLASEVLKAALPQSGNSLRIGISGIPGVGKSTFIEVFGLELIKRGHRVAVLAVDPSSPVSGGSILGDKTRMEELSQHPDSFIRPSPTSGNLGGVSSQTREAIYLCEANGFDIVLVETVGVGQSEYEVSSMVDLFLVLMVPGAGDELQGIKKGIIELCDILIFNKADGDLQVTAENSKNQYEGALSIVKKEGFWTPIVLTCSSLNKKGFHEIITQVTKYHEQAKEKSFFVDKRQEQKKAWLKSFFNKEIHRFVEEQDHLNTLYLKLEKDVFTGKISTEDASKRLIQQLFKAEY
jgi:LAO/AO transport system kinase